jgi:hypothetical protein
MAKSRSGSLRGARKVRRLLKRLPEDVRVEMVAVLREKAPAITAYSRAATPRKSGALAAAIGWKVLPKTLSLRVGLLTKSANQRLPYGKVLERGRGWKFDRSRRFQRRLSGGGLSSVIYMYIKRIGSTEYDFTAGRAVQAASIILKPSLDALWERALRRASDGGDA